ncbi:hypothetical protein MFLAVUS_002682 [Mucor flavus]|uniref:DASH complex subunit DAD1 n=1 Tax=Mucor flavus TaxID=439312 RepID=A0ABP9YQX8_9FUNG
MDKAQFEEQRSIILEKSVAGLEQIKNNLDILNRNLEVINSIGLQFQSPAHLWDSFHKAIGSSEEESRNNQENKESTEDSITDDLVIS